MRWPVVIAIALVAGALLAACGRGDLSATAGNGAVHPPADGAAEHFACVSTYGHRVASCLVMSDVQGPAGEDLLKRSCEADPSQHFTDACPQAKLVGCCTVIGSEGFRSETCYYDTGLLDGTPAKCAATAGYWSAQP